MAPDITTASIDIRVPPMFITDHAVLNNFPELFYTKQGRLVTFNQRLRSSSQTIANSKEENITCPDTFSKDTSLLPDMTCTEDFIKKGSSGETPVCDREEADDLFDPEYVLPDNCQWWQQVDDISFEAPIGDFDVVDLPHFGDNLNYSGLWEDVDTFVSVADATETDVTEERAVHEPVYCLDTRKTTVWGLDIIWEDEEHNCEILE